MTAILGVALLFSWPAHSRDLNLNQDPTTDDYVFAASIQYPVENREKVFRADKATANFTFFHGVEGLTVEDGKLGFALSGKKATLGWGNYMGRQPIAQIEDMGQQQIVIQVGVRQSMPQSKWTARLWRDGERLDRTASAVLKGQKKSELSFKALRTDGANADGLELTVEAEPGTRFEVEYLKLIQPTYEGYCRTEFVLPEGRIWRAIANVGSANERHWTGMDEITSRLHVNGKVVERRGARHLYHTYPVDIAPYLKPGKNCVGFYGFRIGYSPFIYFQAKVIMESGEVVTVGSRSR